MQACKSPSSCLCIQSARITGVHHHAWLSGILWWFWFVFPQCLVKLNYFSYTFSLSTLSSLEKFIFNFFSPFKIRLNFFPSSGVFECALARKLLTWASHFCLGYFSGWVLWSFCTGPASDLDPPISTSCVNWDHMCIPSSMAYLLRWCFTNFLLQLASNHHPPNLCFSSSWEGFICCYQVIGVLYIFWKLIPYLKDLQIFSSSP
jgi:hypothetical protein